MAPVRKPLPTPTGEAAGEPQAASSLVEVHFCTSCGKMLCRPEEPTALLLCTYARDNDSRALAVLIAAKQQDLVRIATNWCREWELPPYWGEDVVQLTLVKIARKAHKFDCAKPAWPWLSTVLKRTFLDFYRRETRLRFKPLCIPTVENDDGSTNPREPADHPRYEPPREALFHERDELLERAIAQLPERERLAFVARQAGKSNQQIAAELGCSESTACTLYGNAVRLLRNRLQ